ncbi:MULTISPECIES: YhcB family protein [Pseudomonas]|uniref:Z-ring associated protein G n=2 Tax=Pseudomonas flexibilis TaxID=706570 RepID=A0A0B3C123_9PSED|nr:MULTISPECIES: DUF1043 family protein [Pseudomonas]KHL70939.1 hypothetical protein SF06_03490 [Pseudomonas flexibilis]KHO65262.1 cytochrome D ubiquinol oxidase subunit III [Pseudomonas flexibilis]
MEQSLMVWLVPAIALLVGVVIGFLISRLAPGAAPSRTQSQLDELQERFETYQSEVVTHFNTTAALVRKLTQSYQDVQEHLTEGIDRLALDEVTRQRLLSALHDQQKRERLQAPESDLLDSQAPKDYAPKPAGAPGTLDEHYGLKHP